MNEDFVSLSLAKKLKEKGFRWDCFAYYMPHSDELIYNVKPYKGVTLYSFNSLRKELISSDFIDAPTISQVLKWLRDSNAIHIHICLYSKGWYCDVYTFKYYEEDREYGVKHNVQFDEFSTYEEAALAGIEYVIDNLI